jgi:hypothetical protein
LVNFLYLKSTTKSAIGEDIKDPNREKVEQIATAEFLLQNFE